MILLYCPSSRASIALYKCSRVLAMLEGRDYVVPDDVKSLAHLGLDHRVFVRTEAEMDDVSPHTVIQRTLNQVPVPKPAV